MEAPDICEKFTYKGNRYRVVSWVKVITKYDKLLEKDVIRLVSSNREDAEGVEGYGVSGVLVPLEKITLEGGYVNWSKEDIDYHRDRANEMAQYGKHGYPIDFAEDTHARLFLELKNEKD